MSQETGETRDAIIEDDNKMIQKIVYANRHRLNKYWIVVFAKPSKNSVDGKPVLVKHIKPYAVKPSSQVGMICGEVDNAKGTLDWEVNLPQVPFDFEKLHSLGAKRCDDVVIETSTIADAYITK